MDFNQYPNMKEKLAGMKASNNGNTRNMAIAFAVFGVLTVMANESGRRAGEGNSGMLLASIFIFFAASVSYLIEWSKATKAVKATWDEFTEEDLKSIETQSATATVYNDTFMTKEAVITKSEYGPLAVKMKDIIWVYKTEIPQKTLGITAGRASVMVMLDRVGRRFYTATHRLTKTNRQEIDDSMIDFMKELRQYRPNVVYGYDERTAKLAQTDIKKLARMSDGGSKERPGLATYGWELVDQEGSVQNPTPDLIKERLANLAKDENNFILLTPRKPLGGIQCLKIQSSESGYVLFALKEGTDQFESVGQFDEQALIEKINTYASK